MHGLLDIPLLFKAKGHFDHAFVEDLQLGFDAPFNHAFSEILDGVLGVFKDLVSSEVERAAIQGGHLGVQLGGLQSFVVCHAYGSSCGRLDDDSGTRMGDGFHDYTETFLILGGGAVVVTDVKVNDACPRIVSRAGFTDTFLYGIRDRGVVFFEHLGSAYGSGNDQFVHSNLLF